ncbi:glycosyltransferase family 25 protein [Rhizobium sp. RU36D]|uniref:glycosyltransferase family 25 protein n=1 Tax=Rhizobium sp. RU36D TaxID=1907415 RepID=UPI0009D8CDAE|nr:glycosyltransferase family 25 protein [Rhizobium sp. RU36D]SMD10005.1 Glycosyltransferase involved in LPS biosynthesis, GR25 family [Rhizobium sp. RU36D]
MGIELFVIHLARAQSRAPNVKHLIESLPLPGRIIEAVDGRDLTDDEVRAVYRPRLHRPLYPFALSRNEIACFLSHRRAWQAILDHDLDAALIMEDDAAPNGDFLAGLNLAIENLQTCGFIRFPFRDGREWGCRTKVAGQVRLMAPRLVGLGMVTQLVSRTAAAQLLRATEVFDRPVDTLLQMPWASGIAPWSVSPATVREISPSIGGTTLQKQRDRAAKLHREIMRPFYRLQLLLHSGFSSIRVADRSLDGDMPIAATEAPPTA